MKKLLAMATMCFVAAACSKSPSNHGGTDGGGEPDAASASDADALRPDATARDTGGDGGGGDAASDDAGSGCLQVTVADDFGDAYADDVSIEYDVALNPEIAGETRRLALLFERYSTAQYEGTFELGTGDDDNFGTCAHCLFVRGDSPARAWFADRGTLVSNSNPFGRRVDFEVTNLRLIEVAVDLETRTSAPLRDGSCIEVADFSTAGAHPPSAWICDDAKYDDGVACSCACGAFDPDCSVTSDCLLGDPSCTPEEPTEPLPIEGCQPEQVCAFEPVAGAPACATTCDWDAKIGCAEGTCVFDGGVGSDGDLCITAPERLAPDVAVGEPCPNSFYALVCAVEDGFAQGYCGPNGVCRGLCASDAECTETGHTCRFFNFEQTLGYCGPEPTDG